MIQVYFNLLSLLRDLWALESSSNACSQAYLQGHPLRGVKGGVDSAEPLMPCLVQLSLPSYLVCWSLDINTHV